MSSKLEQYDRILLQARGLFDGIDDYIANLSNLSALLFMELDQVNWVGCYLAQDDELMLGPFQGKPACVKIAIGKGVCGAAAATGETQLVEDVHEFDGHIACDAASNSEIVIPMFEHDQLIGVFDIDSPVKARFDQEDQQGLEALIVELMKSSKLRTKPHR